MKIPKYVRKLLKILEKELENSQGSKEDSRVVDH